MAATGANHTMVLRNDGTIYSWGLNTRGQLGSYQTNAIPDEANTTHEGAQANGNPADRYYPFRTGSDDHHALFLNNALSFLWQSGSFKPEEMVIDDITGEKLLPWVLPAKSEGNTNEMGEEAFAGADQLQPECGHHL